MTARRCDQCETHGPRVTDTEERYAEFHRAAHDLRRAFVTAVEPFALPVLRALSRVAR